MDILVKAQPKLTKEMVKSSVCNFKIADGADSKPVIDPALEMDEKALFYINYSSLIENPIK